MTKKQPAPPPWHLKLLRNKNGFVVGMLVTAANGKVVEHRTGISAPRNSGYTPDEMAQHIANARLYVACVNEVHGLPADAHSLDSGASSARGGTREALSLFGEEAER